MNYMNVAGHSAALVTTLCLNHFTPLWAAEEVSPSNALPPIVVQASRLGKSTLQMPATTQVISGEEIAASGCATVAEVLERQGGVFIRSLNSTPALAQVAMRGFGDNSFGRVLIMVNGERLNNPDMAVPNLLRVPVGSISRVEIIRGPQSVLQGDYALAGVINIITDDTTAEPETTLGGSVGAYDTYAGFVNTTGGFVEEGLSYRASMDWDKSGGYRDNSAYESWQVNGALRKEFTERRYLALSTFYHLSDYDLPGALTRHDYIHKPRSSVNQHDGSELESFGLNLGGRANVGMDGYIETHATVSRRKTDSHWLGYSFGSPWRMLYNGAIDSYALRPQYVWDLERSAVHNILTLGGDLRFDKSEVLSHYASPYYSSLLEWDYERATSGGYAQDELFITEELSLILGGRMEWFDNRVKNHGAFAGDTTSFSTREHALEAALLYRPSENSKVYAKAGRVYHAPFIDEIFAGVGTPNLNLTPEKGYNFELGGEIEVVKEWRATLAVYDLELEDEIYYDPLVFQNRNAPGETRRTGVDASLGWTRREVGGLLLNYSAVQAEFSGGAYDGKRVPLVPRHTLGVSGEYTLCYGVSALAGVRYVANQVLGSDFNNEAERLKPYMLADCGLRYEPSFMEGLRVSFGVDNLTGNKYCDYAGWSSTGGSYYYPARGRFWKLGAAYSF